MDEPARLFTLEEANALLPRLRVLLLDIQARKREIDELRQSLGEVHERVRRNGHGIDAAEVERRQERLREAGASLRDLIQEVTGLGVQLKDLDTGLVDFPAEREGRVVLLCWKLDEPEVLYWHPIETGFAGRQPLPSDE